MLSGVVACPSLSLELAACTVLDSIIRQPIATPQGLDPSYPACERGGVRTRAMRELSPQSKWSVCVRAMHANANNVAAMFAGTGP